MGVQVICFRNYPVGGRIISPTGAIALLGVREICVLWSSCQLEGSSNLLLHERLPRVGRVRII